MYQEKYSIFECGFHSFLGQNRSNFYISFFVYGARWLRKSHQCLKLSNSGEALKVWLPRNGTKAICKWINNPFAVTISKMMETEIGNHGSKSIIVVSLINTLIVVNEQRVNGSWWGNYRITTPNKKKCISHLRCTLMGFERNYQISALSNTIHTSIGSSSDNKKVVLRSSLENFKLDPWWVTGFVDAEGCFNVSFTENQNYKLGWRVKLRFQLVLHEKDKPILDLIKKHFSCGQISKNGKSSLQFTVQSFKDLGSIIKFFKKYNLHTQKRTDFEFCEKIYVIILKKEHLTLAGLRKIWAIKASMNRGLSYKLKLAKAPPPSNGGRGGVLSNFNKIPPPGGGDFAKISLSWSCSCRKTSSYR